MSKKSTERFISYMHKNFRPILVIGLCVYGLYLRIAALAGRDFSSDEMFQLSLLNQPFPDFFKALPNYEYCSYLSGDYFLLFPFLKLFGYNKWGLAIPHMIITILGFYLLYLIAKRYLKTIFGYFVVFLVVVLNPNLISHALEMRAYAVLPTLSLACLYFFQKFLINEETWVKKIAIGAFFVLTAWFHVYGILILFFTLFFSLWEIRSHPEFKLIVKKSL